MRWTDEQDRRLMAADAALQGATAGMLAERLSSELGVALTEDMVRNRLKRVRAQIALSETEPTRSLDAQRFDAVAAPKDEYVGPRLAFFDIETTGLKGHVGRMLGGSIADSWGNVTSMRLTDYPGKTLIDDGPLADAYARELETYDEWVSWNGKLFDVPFLNARLMKAGLPVLRADIIHVDLMYYSKGSLSRIGTSRLAGVSEFFNTPNSKSAVSFDIWNLAMAGDKGALDYVMDHCDADVLVTRDVYAHLKPLIRNKHR